MSEAFRCGFWHCKSRTVCTGVRVYNTGPAEGEAREIWD